MGTTYTLINGVVDQLTSANTTWSVVDSITTAANGTANLSLITNGATSVGLSATGVATLNVKAIDQNAATTNSGLDVTSFTNLTTLKIANSATLGTTNGTADLFSVTGIGAGDVLLLDTNGQFTNTSFTFATAATQGSADTVTLNIAGRNGTVNVATGFETAAITTTGTDARVAGFTTTTAKTLTIAGTGLKIDGALDATLTSLDASTSTGNVDVNITGAATLVAIKAGAGTADRLATAALQSANIVTGFEIIEATAAATYDLTGVTGATSVAVGVGAGAVSFTNALATTNTISLSGANQRTTAVDTTSSLTTGGNVTFALKTATAANDAAIVLVNNAGTASTGTYTVGGTLTLSGLEVVTFTASDWKAVALTGITDALSSTGNLTFTATATASNLALGAVAISGGLATGTNVFNLGAVTGTTTVVFTEAENFTFTGGTGVDTVTTGSVSGTLLQTYNTGTGNDIITVVATAAGTGQLAINTGADDDTISLGAAILTGDTFNIDGGAGTDTIRVTAGASFIDSMIGIEKISVQGAVVTTIAGSSTTANNTVEITQIAAGTVVFTATAGQTVNLSGVTQVGSAILTLTGSTGAETLTGSSTIGTTIASGTGADIITLGTNTAQDIIVSTVGIAYSTATADIITGFVMGAGADVFQVDISDSTLAGTGGIVTNGAGAAAIAGNLVVQSVAKGAGATVFANGSEILVVTGTYADSAAFITDIGTTAGTTALSWGTDPTAGVGFLAVWFDGTNTHVSKVSDADAVTSVAMVTADLALTDLVLLVGNKTVGVDTTNFIAVA